MGAIDPTKTLAVCEAATNYLEANDAETTLDGSEWDVVQDLEYRHPIAWCWECKAEAVFSKHDATFIAQACTELPAYAGALQYVIERLKYEVANAEKHLQMFEAHRPCESCSRGAMARAMLAELAAKYEIEASDD